MKNDLIYARHILDAINKIKKYVASNSYQSFSKDEKTIDAVVRELEIIGEAARNFSKQFIEKYQTLPIREMVGMRNNLIHEYFDVDAKTVWQTCLNNLPPLKKTIQKILKEELK